MDIQELFRPRLPEADVEIPDVGTVRVRGLSRFELLHAGAHENKGVAHVERAMLAAGMVDPPMTEAEAGQWQKASPAGEIMPVVAKINELSGIGRDAHKEAYKSLRDGPDAGV